MHQLMHFLGTADYFRNIAIFSVIAEPVTASLKKSTGISIFEKNCLINISNVSTMHI